MCTVTNGFFCIEYEVVDGRRCKPGDVKDIVVNFINHTGSLKFVIDLKCRTYDTFIELIQNVTYRSDAIRVRVFLPPAYRKRGSILFQKCQVSTTFGADISSSASSFFKTVIECRAMVSARANRNDPDALRYIRSYPRVFDFYPPLETTP